MSFVSQPAPSAYVPPPLTRGAPPGRCPVRRTGQPRLFLAGLDQSGEVDARSWVRSRPSVRLPSTRVCHPVGGDGQHTPSWTRRAREARRHFLGSFQARVVPEGL